MVTIGIDPHKDTHWAVAVDEVGRQLADRKCHAVSDGFGELLAWARNLSQDRTWVLEDCRHVSGPFERFLIDRGERVARLAPHLMAEAGSTVRERPLVEHSLVEQAVVVRAAVLDRMDRAAAVSDQHLDALALDQAHRPGREVPQQTHRNRPSHPAHSNQRSLSIATV